MTAQTSPLEPSGRHKSTGPDKLSAAEKTLLVLEAITGQPRFSDVVASTGLAKATAHRLLAVLSAHGFVTLGDDGTYLAGPKILALAGQATRTSRILDIAEPYLDELVEEVDCTAHLGTLNGDRVIYTIKAEAKGKPYQMPSRVGREVPLHSSAMGKAMLAGFSAEQLDRYLSNNELASRTVHTITDPDALRAELEEVKRRGYALDREENVPGIICVGAAVHDHLGRTRHAVSISTITLEHTLPELEAMASQVIACAARIADALGYQPPQPREKTGQPQ